MKHIPVLSLGKLNDINRLILDQTNYCLISIISGLHQKEFGLDTLSKIKTKIRKFKKDINDCKLFIDSGGYSIIIGDINPRDFMKFIDCYHDYLNYEYNNFNYIFSLDIPISLKYSDINTTQSIYKWNNISLSKSKKLIETNEDIRNKFYFVWHFKILKQYKIWDKLYNELELNNLVSHNQAIGGLVGLRDIVKINFTPFIGMTFKLLYNYISAGNFNKPLKIHILGIYVKVDRFCVCFLEKLFNKILKQYNTSCTFTYDSINYILSAYLKARELEIFHINENNMIEKFNTSSLINEDILKLVYKDNFEYIMNELKRIYSNDKLDQIHSFAPLNVYSQLQIDKFISNQIDNYNLIDEIINCSNWYMYKNYVNSVLYDLNYKHGILFTNLFISAIEESIKYIYAFYSLIKNDKFNQVKLNEMIEKTIANINYPFDLN